jgi:hypothetical protein
MSNFGQVEICVETRNGQSIANQTYMPNINIGNVASNNFSSPAQQTFQFDVTEQGDYVIAIYSAASGWSDCIVGQLSLTVNSYSTTGIGATFNDKGEMINDNLLYDLQGRQVIRPNKAGIYVKKGKKILIR